MKHIFFVFLCFILLSFSKKDEDLIVTNEMAREWNTININGKQFFRYGTPEMYGWTTASTIEETNATLQNLFDTTVTVNLSAQTYSTSAQLDIDTVSGQTINGNAAIISVTSQLPIVIKIDKRTSNAGKTVMNNLTVNGNDNGKNGFQIWSAVEFNNVDVNDMFQYDTSGGSSGIWLELYNDPEAYAQGDWIFDGCDLDFIHATGDNIPGNSFGSSNAFLVFHREIVSPSNDFDIIFRNASITDSFGADAEHIGTFSPGLDVTNQGVDIIFEDLILTGWERRSVKAFCGNLTFRRVDITETAANDPKLTGLYTPAGMFVFASSSGATGAGNALIEDCVFRGNGGTEYLNTVVVISNYGCDMRRNTFLNGTKFLIGGILSNLTVCANNMTNGGIIGENTDQPPQQDDGGIVFDTDNTYSSGTPFANITNYTITEADLDCGTFQSASGNITPILGQMIIN